MTVLSVGYPLFPVSLDSSGGSEQVLFLLEREVMRAGHKSIVIAAEGSKISGQLVATPRTNGEITDEIRQDAQRAHLDAIRETLRKYPIDIIHFHGLDFHTYVPETSVPMLATLHLPLAWYPEHAFRLSGVTLNCVSDVQAKGTGLRVIKNGIDVGRYRTGNNKDEYLLWIGRVCPEKGVDIALRVAHRLDRHLMVAGPVHAFESHQRYFSECVRPLLDEKRRYIGPVDGDLKTELLACARCLLVPSLVAETSSLVAMEAAASGVPVVSLRSGALPEVVEHGKTGFVVDSEDEMVEAVSRVHEIAPAACRATALRRFDSRRMTSEYLELYSLLTQNALALR